MQFSGCLSGGTRLPYRLFNDVVIGGDCESSNYIIRSSEQFLISDHNSY